MTDLLAMSSEIIDTGTVRGPVNRILHELSEIAEGIAVVEAFSHSVLFRSEAGLVVFDTSGAHGGGRVVEAIRRWSDARFHTLVFTHGHIDHVGGCGAFLADAAQSAAPRPTVIGHENVAARFERYELTNGYNLTINERQFGAFRRFGLEIGGRTGRFLPDDVPRPDVTYRDRLDRSIGGLDIELHHGRGETDDHTWAWIPAHKAICAGDFFIWNFPNAGNPQKVQRYPREWAAVLRTMADLEAELFLPAHGLPIAGKARIQRVLGEVAGTLERLVRDTLEMMNAGVRLSEVLQQVRVDDEVLERPYLRPLYDEPEFVVRNIWRQYGGWYDGNPAHLKPASERALAGELASLAGGASELAARAGALMEAGELRLACHLAELASLAAPEDADVHAVRAVVFERRRDQELSLMAKGIFGHVAHASRLAAGHEDPSR